MNYVESYKDNIGIYKAIGVLQASYEGSGYMICVNDPQVEASQLEFLMASTRPQEKNFAGILPVAWHTSRAGLHRGKASYLGRSVEKQIHRLGAYMKLARPSQNCILKQAVLAALLDEGVDKLPVLR